MQEFGDTQQPDLIIRASSLSTLWDCPARFKAEQLEGKRLPSGAAATIGTAIHAGAAVFDTQRMEGKIASVEDATDAAAQSVREAREGTRWDDCRPAEAIDKAVSLTNAYCHDIAPTFTYRKVEVKLNSLDVKASNGIVIRFTGHIDRERIEAEKLGVCDLKSGANIIAADGGVKVSAAAGQLAVYEMLTLLADHTMQEQHLLPAQIIALPTTGKHPPKVATLNKQPYSLLIGDEQNKGLIEVAAALYKNDIFFGNPRSMCCTNKYCSIFDSCRWRLTAEAE